MTDEQRAHFREIADELEKQINGVDLGGYEVQQAMIRLTEAVMWMRRAIERS